MKSLKLMAAMAAMILAGGCGMEDVEKTDQESIPAVADVTQPPTTLPVSKPAVTAAVSTANTTRPAVTTAAVTSTAQPAASAPAKPAAQSQPASQNYDVTDYVYEETGGAEQTYEPPAQPSQGQPAQPAPSKPSRSGLSPGEVLDTMSLREKVCQMFIVAPESFAGSTVQWWNDQWYSMKYADYPVGGFILFSANISYSDQLRTLTSSLQSSAKSCGIGAFIAVDEEGGSITRVCCKLGTTAVNNMAWYGANSDTGQVKDAGNIIGSYLADYGFNVDFAPVADVNISSANELGNRIFSSDPGVVSDMSAAFVEGLHSGGVCSTLKHFPGLGAGNGNTHYGTVVIDRSHDQLAETEFRAFGGGIQAGSDFVMVGHQITTGSGDDAPGDFSHVVVTDWLRGELGFDGLAITDSQAMGAIANSYSSGEAAVRAIDAGIDIILMPADLRGAVSGVEEAVKNGTLSEERINESVLRILEKKQEYGIF